MWQSYAPNLLVTMTIASKPFSRFITLAGFGLGSLLFALPGRAEVAPKVETLAQASGSPTIAAIASSSSSFDVLTALLNHAGWTGAFDSPSKSFTVFAPTDDAFGRLPKGTIEQLFKPESKEMLYDVLAYHVIGGSVTSDALANGPVTTKNGLPIEVSLGQGVRVNSANVSQADISASNGTIHVIDQVLIPNR